MNKIQRVLTLIVGFFWVWSSVWYPAARAAKSQKRLKGRVRIDGSSTVYPITEAVAEEFSKKYPGVKVTVGISGTGGGFKKFLNSEIDINDASRKIKSREKTKAAEKRVEYWEIPVAFDGISVVVHPRNNWVDYLSVDELHRLWKPGSSIVSWNQIRSNWPNKEIKLYGPGTHSGTFDYFTRAVNGKSQMSRADFFKSEDDNTLVRGVAGDEGSLGYFGLSYYLENRSQVRSVPIKYKNENPVGPSVASVGEGSYKPLSRKVFIYVNKKSLLKPSVSKFIQFYLNHASELVQDVGYVSLKKEEYKSSWKRVQKTLVSI